MYEIENAKAARNRKIANTFMWIVLLIFFVAFVFPFIVAVINAFKANTDINRFPLALVGPRKGFILDNFPTAMAKMNFWGVFLNSTASPQTDLTSLLFIPNLILSTPTNGIALSVI